MECDLGIKLQIEMKCAVILYMITQENIIS